MLKKCISSKPSSSNCRIPEFHTIIDIKQQRLEQSKKEKNIVFLSGAHVLLIIVPFGEAQNLSFSRGFGSSLTVNIIHTLLLPLGLMVRAVVSFSRQGLMILCSHVAAGCLVKQWFHMLSPLLQLAMWRTVRGCPRWTNLAGTPRATGFTSTSCSRQ